MKLLSIIVPVYNTKEEYLRACVTSLLHQTLSDYEIILVNDASTDNTLFVLQQYEQAYPGRVRVIDSPVNLKQGGARNLGLRAAQGKYIAFVDSDDVVDETMYEKMLCAAAENDADAVVCRYRRFDDAGNILGESKIPQVWKEKNAVGNAPEEYFLNSASVACKIFRRLPLIQNQVFFPEKMFYEDNAWCPLSILYMDRTAYVDQALYQYRLNPQSTTECGSFEKYYDRCRSARWLENELNKRGLKDRVPEAADFWFFHCHYASCVKMFITGFDRVYTRQLREIRDVTKRTAPAIWKNKYYLQNYLKYEAEDRFYLRLTMRSPFWGVAAVRFVSWLRKIKHALKRSNA